MVKAKEFVAFVVAIVFTVSSSGCAAMFHGTSQQINIRSNQPDAELFVNEASVGKGSATTVFKKSEDYTLAARKPGCEQAMTTAQKSFDPVTLLGILIDWGIITILVIDGAATGAWRQFDQTSYVLDPKCPPPPPPVPPAAPNPS